MDTSDESMALQFANSTYCCPTKISLVRYVTDHLKTLAEDRMLTMIISQGKSGAYYVETAITEWSEDTVMLDSSGAPQTT